AVINGAGANDYRVVTDLNEQLNQLSSITLRQNPTADPILADWFLQRLVLPWALELDRGPAGTVTLTSDNVVWATRYTLQMAEDGLPIEDFELAFRP
ncbi:MAG: hypothetical protein AAGJ52_10095, partial [Pseudomonadota bacterium]